MPRKALTQDLAGSGVRFLRINADQSTTELTAAQMLAAIGGPIIKAGSGTTRSSTSFATDSEFSVAVGAGETWKLDYKLFFLENNGAGAKAQLVFNGMTISGAMGLGYWTGAGTTFTAILAPDGTSPFEVVNQADDFYHIVDFTMTFTATVGGTVLLQWAASAAFNVTLLSHSTVTATRVS